MPMQFYNFNLTYQLHQYNTCRHRKTIVLRPFSSSVFIITTRCALSVTHTSRWCERDNSIDTAPCDKGVIRETDIVFDICLTNTHTHAIAVNAKIQQQQINAVFILKRNNSNS